MACCRRVIRSNLMSCDTGSPVWGTKHRGHESADWIFQRRQPLIETILNGLRFLVYLSEGNKIEKGQVS